MVIRANAIGHAAVQTMLLLVFTIERRDLVKTHAHGLHLTEPFRRNCFNRHRFFLHLVILVGFCLPEWPDMKAARLVRQFPQSPDSFAFAKPTIINIVSADVSLGPVALTVFTVESADHNEMADIVTAIA